ncbi:phosphate regulon sensor histidine kinase PhoR [Rubrivivax gelatinosus]|uniref:Phosphate regulon sensor protein PhoR n=1 Tax=Rubrivivax gelatinosus TaxID=28068 RepID=A0ABS1DNV9_RUBGE|nr:phosphate regulon sensor histidine kinase PhoR [Rubrivivax gelatinosus]MBK1612552.1 phosphate regulon sensor histidine kinase PhoR [Rubrivivax gelatinosus]MBK1711697.1 phosphate regulon sensor histidine kinase PhoR [Rubrivivax gelatinosus]
MSALLSRAVWAMLAAALGALLGDAVGHAWGHATTGAPVGAALLAALAAAVDGWRGRRLLAWLRTEQTGAAPRDTGFWGELGYRVERGFRQREHQIERERGRLEQFLSAIEASPNGVMLLDAGGQIEWCNSVAADHFGLDPVRDRRQRVTNLVRQPAFVAFLQAGAFDEPLTLVDPLGRRSFSVIVREYGEGLRLVLSLDVTERERADAMRRDFVANVSHEIRTPLTVLAGFVETMASLPLTPVERERVLKLMEQQTDRMQALVSDLLTLAQLEGSPRPPPDRWWPVASLLLRAQADGRSLSAGRHEITASGGEDAEIAGSETELLSAIGNLVGNAVRYTPEGGRIELRFRQRDDGGADIEVSDTGVGIAREHLSRLTERFYRVDSSRSRDTGGTGLGLSIVKHVVQRHGGEIDVASEPGKGSRFKLGFPAARLRQRAPASTAPAGAA